MARPDELFRLTFVIGPGRSQAVHRHWEVLTQHWACHDCFAMLSGPIFMVTTFQCEW